MASEVHAASERYTWQGCLFGSLKDTGDWHSRTQLETSKENKEVGQDEHRY
jgi:hypothetical protein